MYSDCICRRSIFHFLNLGGNQLTNFVFNLDYNVPPLDMNGCFLPGDPAN